MKKTTNINHLGKGLDSLTYEYPNPPLQGQVIDLSSLHIERTPLSSTKLKQTYGSSFTEFIEKFSLSVGLSGAYKGFVGSVDATYSSNKLESEHKKWVRLYCEVSSFQHSITQNISTLKEHLSEEFKKAINTQTPEEILKIYGSHVVIKAKIGGSASYIVNSRTNVNSTEEDFILDAEALFLSVGGNANIKYNRSGYESRVEGNSSLSVTGGSAATQVNLRENTSDAWKTWAQSIEESQAFIGVAEDGLIPIWDLVYNPEMSDNLKKEFLTNLALQFQIRVFSATSLKSNRPEQKVTVPNGYKMLSGGASISFDPGQAGCLLTESYPESENTWRAMGKDHNVPDPTGQITTYAVGLYDPLDLWQVKINSATSGTSQAPTATVGVFNGYTMVGGGAKTNYVGPGILLTESYPVENTNAWKASGKDHNQPNAGTITSYAIGLKVNQEKIPNKIHLTSEIKSSISSLSSLPTIDVAVQNGYILTGGGARIEFNNSGILMTKSYPAFGNAQNVNSWYAQGKDHYSPDNGKIEAYAIGLKVTKK